MTTDNPFVEYVERRLTSVVASIERDTGRAARSTAVAARCGLSRRTAQRWLAWAEQHGFIVREGVKCGWRVGNAGKPRETQTRNEASRQLSFTW